MRIARREKIIGLIALILAVPSFSLILSAQGTQPNTAGRVERTKKLLKPVEKYVKSIEEFVGSEGDPHLVFADISDYNENEKPIWQKYRSKAEFEAARNETEAYTVAFVWRNNGNPVAVNFTYSSPSGDWAQFVRFVFRPNGTLARISSNLNTFYGDATILRTFWFDAKVNLIKETAEYRDLQSNELFDPKDRDFFDRDVEVYKTVRSLPFSKLLIKARRKARKK